MIRIGFDTICNCQPDITYILLDIRLALHRIDHLYDFNFQGYVIDFSRRLLFSAFQRYSWQIRPG